ncbi:glycosyl hydrolase, glycosyl hydrolase family 15, partial [mine drainage metagenome]
KHYVYSKVMAWVAVDRGIDLGERLGLVGPYDHWRRVRETIREDVLRRGTTARGGGLGWFYGASAPDASLLLLPTTGFLEVDDPVMDRTVAEIERSLVDEPFVARYRLPDHLRGREGYFLPCAFWRVEYYTMRGELTRARRLFESLLRTAGPLGLFAEEIDRRGRHLGNYPQAFTHLALLLAATRLDRAFEGGLAHLDETPRRPTGLAATHAALRAAGGSTAVRPGAVDASNRSGTSS